MDEAIRCRLCGRPEHGAAACETVNICRACAGQGGFTFFQLYQGEGASPFWTYETIVCSLCGGTGKEAQ